MGVTEEDIARFQRRTRAWARERDWLTRKEERLAAKAEKDGKVYRKRTITPQVIAMVLKGRELKERFLEGLPALGKLVEVVQERAKERNFLIGLDGRRLEVRKPHAALNTLLQSAGAILCKDWMVSVRRDLAARGWKRGWDGDFNLLAWVHDETQWAVRRHLAEELKDINVEQARLTGERFAFRCPLAGEGKIGSNWSECH